MKNLLKITVVTLLLSFTGYSQRDYVRLVDVVDDVILHKRINSKTGMNVEGTPYVNKVFMPAVVSGAAGNAMMRYDIFNDQFEFVNGVKDTLVLNKAEPFTNVTFTITNTKYQLLDYNNGEKTINGYLIALHEGTNASLYKKQNITFTKEKIAKSGYDSNAPARFDKNDDSYYWKNGDKEISKFPASKKQLLKLYPDKKAKIEDFLKRNEINFEKDADLIKLVDFLSAQ